MSAQITRLADGRLHFHHGPIDIIAEAWGEAKAIAAAEAAAAQRFATLLEELVRELPLLRKPEGQPKGAIARVMASAVRPFHPAFVTPMAAVAGAVAQAVLAPFQRPGIAKAYVNNGGDIALHLTEGESFHCAIAGSGSQGAGREQITLRYADPVRGIATSGWRGRSFSLGIADAVTVLAPSAAMADAAATMIANAVDLPGHASIQRQPADQLQCDSDLGSRLVTTAVAPLPREDIRLALGAGEKQAKLYRDAGLIESAALFLQSETRIIGAIALKEPEFA